MSVVTSVDRFGFELMRVTTKAGTVVSDVFVSVLGKHDDGREILGIFQTSNDALVDDPELCFAGVGVVDAEILTVARRNAEKLVLRRATLFAHSVPLVERNGFLHVPWTSIVDTELRAYFEDLDPILCVALSPGRIATIPYPRSDAKDWADLLVAALLSFRSLGYLPKTCQAVVLPSGFLFPFE